MSNIVQIWFACLFILFVFFVFFVFSFAIMSEIKLYIYKSTLLASLYGVELRRMTENAPQSINGYR